MTIVTCLSVMFLSKKSKIKKGIILVQKLQSRKAYFRIFSLCHKKIEEHKGECDAKVSGTHKALILNARE